MDPPYKKKNGTSQTKLTNNLLYNMLWRYFIYDISQYNFKRITVIY